MRVCSKCACVRACVRACVCVCVWCFCFFLDDCFLFLIFVFVVVVVVVVVVLFLCGFPSLLFLFFVQHDSAMSCCRKSTLKHSAQFQRLCSAVTLVVAVVKFLSI